MSRGEKIKGVFSDTGWLMIFLLLIFGAVGSVIAVQQGWLTSEQIAKYGMWVIIGLIALYLFAGRVTRTRWDDIIVSYLLLLSIGGFAGTWLVDNGYVTQGYLLMGGLGLVFLILLAIYSKTGYAKVGRRFE